MAASRNHSVLCYDIDVAKWVVRIITIVIVMPRQLTLDLSLPKMMRLRKPLGPLNPNTAGRVQGEQC